MRKHMSLFLTASSLFLTQGAMASYLEQSNDIIMIDLGLSSQGATSSTAGSLTNSVVNGIENLGITASSAGSNLVNIQNPSQGRDTITIPVPGNPVVTSQVQATSAHNRFEPVMHFVTYTAPTAEEIAARAARRSAYTAAFGISATLLTADFLPGYRRDVFDVVPSGSESSSMSSTSNAMNLENTISRAQGDDTITVPLLSNSGATSQTQFVVNQLAQPMIIENVPASAAPVSDDALFIADVEDALNAARTPAEVAAIRSSAQTQYITHFGNSARVFAWPFQPRD